jgi:glycosyltransferase involved in cell wall biosynthesis
VLGTLARLVPYKGVHHMIRATALVREERPAVRLVVAGGPAAEYPGYADELRALIAELGLEESVELRGFTDDVARVLSELTVFLNATYRDAQGYGSEGMPGSILEASWAGVPVVAHRIGGNVEAVRDGVTGTLVERPDPEALAEAIGRYLRDPALHQRTAAAGAAWTREHFAPEAAAARLFRALRRVVDDRHASPA